MFRSKLLLGIIMAGGLAFVANAAEVVVKVRPPHAIVEVRGARPSAGHVFPGTTIGTATPTRGRRDAGKFRHSRTRDGKLTTGYTATADT
jgi:hypothetical protein